VPLSSNPFLSSSLTVYFHHSFLSSRCLGAMPTLSLLIRFAAVLAIALLPTAGAMAQTPPRGPDAPPAAGSSLPRFVSLRSDEVNLRTGPGVRYPVDWVLQRKYMPVEVLAEFENWRKVRDWQGTEGWVHQSNLSGRRYAIITGEVRSIRRLPETGAPTVARLEAGRGGAAAGVQGPVVPHRRQWLPRLAAAVRVLGRLR
jgi:SH3-like domain-containing protein